MCEETKTAVGKKILEVVYFNLKTLVISKVYKSRNIFPKHTENKQKLPEKIEYCVVMMKIMFKSLKLRSSREL